MAISGTFDKDNVVRFNNVNVEVSLDGGTAWADITSWSTNVEFVRGRVDSDITKTLDGSSHVTTGVSLGPGTIRVTSLYTEVATDPFKGINDAFTANPGLAAEVRWSPAGGASGDYLYTTSGGYMVACDLPGGDAESTRAGRFTFELIVDDAAQSTVTP